MLLFLWFCGHSGTVRQAASFTSTAEDEFSPPLFQCEITMYVAADS
jgi:hypothetical protein